MPSWLTPDRPLHYIHGKNYVKFWENYFETHDWEDDEPFSVYFDFPYCESCCRYCMLGSSNFYKCKDQIKEYEEKLVEQVRSIKHLFGLRPIKVVTFGGGTPSLMSKDTIREILSMIPNYEDTPLRKFEVHPSALTPEYVDFLINDMHLNRVTMGIQSFDKEANKNQKRIPCDVNQLIESMRKLQENGIYINIDLVALFDFDNGDEEKGWENFRNDLRIIDELVKPDSFCCQINYATQDRFYEHLYTMRKILKDFVHKSKQKYYPEEETMISTNKIDILQNRDTNDVMVTPKCRKFLNDRQIWQATLNFANYIGFGGSKKHHVFSIMADNRSMYGYYDFDEKRWVHYIMETLNEKIVTPSDGKITIPEFNCGPYVIKPNDVALSWLNEINKE